MKTSVRWPKKCTSNTKVYWTKKCAFNTKVLFSLLNFSPKSSRHLSLCARSPQELVESDDVAPYICGVAVGEAPLFPLETTRLSLTVDDEICGDNAKFSLVSMLSE